MNNEKHYYKSPLLFKQDVKEIQEAIIIAQNYWGDRRTGGLDWNAYCQKRINELERILNSIEQTHWKELPEPTEEA